MNRSAATSVLGGRVAAALGGVAVALAPAAAGAAPSVRAVHTATGEVRACLPTADGGALVGTGGGLVRVGADGTARARWTASDGLPGTRIDTVVAAGGDGAALEAWIGADGGAARVRVDGDRLSVIRTVAARPVGDVVELDGAIYLATNGGGVVEVGARGAGRAVRFRGGTRLARERVAALAVAGGTLWAGTAAGLFELRRGRFEAVALGGDGPAPVINDLLGDGDRLWIATADGLWSRTGATAVAHGGGELHGLAMVGGELVVAGMGEGLARVDRGRLRGLGDGPTLARAVAARDGAACAGGLDGLWLRGPDGGTTWTRAPAATGIPSNDVSAVAVDGDRLWVGTFDAGLAVIEHGRWRRIEHPDLDPRINAILVEPRPGARARVWIGTAAGLMVIDGDDVGRATRRDGLPGRSVMSLVRLADGRIVAGTSSGTAVVGEGRPVRVGPRRPGNVWAMAEDADGMLWLGTTTGLYRGPSTPVDPKTAPARPAVPIGAGASGDRDGHDDDRDDGVGTGDGETDAGWQRLSVATGHLRDDWVMALTARGRSLWVGTYKGGVTRFDLGAPGDDAAPVATPLGDGWINPGGLRWDGDQLLAATMDGLRIGDGAGARWRAVPGLPGKDVTAAVRTGSTLWVATRRGLAELR